MKWFKTHWVSLLAIGLSLIAIGFSFRNDPLTIDFDSAILVSVATLVSVPTSIVLVWNICNALGVKKEVDIFKKEMSNEMSVLKKRCDVIVKNTEGALADIQEKTKKALRIQEAYCDGCVAFCQALIQDDNHLMRKYKLYASAIVHFCEFENDTENYIDNCLQNMESVINRINNGGKIELKLNTDTSFCKIKGHILIGNFISETQLDIFHKLEGQRSGAENNAMV